MDEMKLAMVVKWGRVSAESAGFIIYIARLEHRPVKYSRNCAIFPSPRTFPHSTVSMSFVVLFLQARYTAFR